MQLLEHVLRQTDSNKTCKKMKKTTCLLALVALATMASCRARTVNHDDGPEVERVVKVVPFEKIKAETACDVYYTQGDVPSLKIVGAESDVKNVVISARNGELNIRSAMRQRLLNLSRQHPVKVYLTSPDLIEVNFSGVGGFYADGRIDTDTLAVALRGVGDVKLEDVICDHIKVRLDGPGDVDIDKLQTQQADVTLRGVGDIDIDFVNSGNVSCTLYGVGDISVKGNVRTFSKNKKGTGDIDTAGLVVAQPN